MIRVHLMRAHPARDGAFRRRGDGVWRIEGLGDAVFGSTWFAQAPEGRMVDRRRRALLAVAPATAAA